MSTYEMEDFTESFALLWPPEIPPLNMAVMRNAAMAPIDSFHALDMNRSCACRIGRPDASSCERMGNPDVQYSHPPSNITSGWLG